MLHERLGHHVFASDHLFADDTPIPVLDPGRGRTKTGRLWVHARDQRGWAGPKPPAVICFYEPDRKAERPRSHLIGYRGTLHVDGYAGFEQLTAKGHVRLAACWAHTRRKFHEIAEADTKDRDKRLFGILHPIFQPFGRILENRVSFKAPMRQHPGALV